MANRVSYTFSLLDRFSAPGRRIARTTEGIRRKFRSLNFDLKRTSAALTKAGHATRYVSLAASGAVAANLKAFGDLSQGVSNVATLLENDAAVRKYEGRLRTLAETAVKNGFSIEDSTKALFDNVSALGANERSFSTFETAQKLAIAGVTDLSIATDGLTSILNAYGKEAGSSEAVAVAFFNAQKYGKTTVAELAQNIGKVAPIAKTAGVSMQELLATTAQLTLGGLSTEEATTALRQALAALVKPGKQAEKILRATGVPIGATAIRSAGLAKTLSKLAVVSEKYPDLLAEAIPNIRAFTAAASLGKDELANVDKIVSTINEDIKTGTVFNAAYGKQQKEFNREMTRTYGSVKILAAQLGEALAPAARLVGGLVRAASAALGAMNPTVRSVIVTLLTAAAAAAPVLFFFGKLGAAAAWVTTAFGAGAIASLGTFAFILGGIAAGIITVVRNWDQLKHEFSTFDWGANWRYIKLLLGADAEELGASTLRTPISPAAAAARADVNVNLNAPKGVVKSIQSKTTGRASGLRVGVNMAEGPA